MGKLWSQEDVDLLTLVAKEGKSEDYIISLFLERTPGAVTEKAFKLGYPSYFTINNYLNNVVVFLVTPRSGWIVSPWKDPVRLQSLKRCVEERLIYAKLTHTDYGNTTDEAKNVATLSVEFPEFTPVQIYMAAVKQGLFKNKKDKSNRFMIPLVSQKSTKRGQ